ncbi:MAG: PAP2 family protein [Bacteroidetes bacterium]|nr:PAP2 family protein [Bacteroidota bacterium]MBL7103424.1 PAP2 family protein [Bacteroidales bacterium]
MEEKIAKIISVVFYPMLIPSYTILILFNINNYISLLIPFSAKLLILGMVFITTFLFPILFIFIMKRKGIVKTLQMETREERIYPFAVTAIFYFLSYYMLKQLHISDIYYLFLLGATFLIIIALLITFYWKISVHMIGIGGMLGALIGISFRINIDFVILIALTVLCSGIVGFARLKLNAHIPLQIYTGFLSGVIIMLLVFLI